MIIAILEKRLKVVGENTNNGGKGCGKRLFVKTPTMKGN